MATKPISKLSRRDKNKVLGGVCGGFGDYLGIDPLIFRIIFVLMTLFGGGGIFIYLVLWIVVPSKTRVGKNTEDYIKENVEELKTKTREVAGKEPKVFLGVILVVIGLSLLMQNLGFYNFNIIWKFWPIALIALGFVMLTKKN